MPSGTGRVQQTAPSVSRSRRHSPRSRAATHGCAATPTRPPACPASRAPRRRGAPEQQDRGSNACSKPVRLDTVRHGPPLRHRLRRRPASRARPWTWSVETSPRSARASPPRSRRRRRGRHGGDRRSAARASSPSRPARSGSPCRRGPSQRGPLGGQHRPLLDRHRRRRADHRERRPDVHVVNDADAPGSRRCGTARHRTAGLVIVTTLGTGIGSALIMDGRSCPTPSCGHLEIDGRDAESRAAYSAREREDLSMEEWAERLATAGTLGKLFSPDLFVVSGGISKRADEFLPLLGIEIGSCAARAAATGPTSSAPRSTRARAGRLRRPGAWAARRPRRPPSARPVETLGMMKFGFELLVAHGRGADAPRRLAAACRW